MATVEKKDLTPTQLKVLHDIFKSELIRNTNYFDVYYGLFEHQQGGEKYAREVKELKEMFSNNEIVVTHASLELSMYDDEERG